MRGRSRHWLLGVPIDDLTMDETIDRVDEYIRAHEAHLYAAINVSKVTRSARDASFSSVIDSVDLATADGQPIVWAARLLGVPLRERVTGVDLMKRLIARAAECRYRLYLLGASPEVSRMMAARVEAEHGAGVVVGRHHGYWRPSDEATIIAAVAAARPDILLVALGSPTQELFLHRWRKDLDVPFMMGVGGSFDVFVVRVRRAPRWMQRFGLEWMFRLAQEPERMWRRYLGDAPLFCWLVFRSCLARARSR